MGDHTLLQEQEESTGLTWIATGVPDVPISLLHYVGMSQPSSPLLVSTPPPISGYRSDTLVCITLPTKDAADKMGLASQTFMPR